MSEHIQKSLIDRYRDRSLDAPAMSAISAHLETCAACHELFRATFRNKEKSAVKGPFPSSKRWLQDEHLEYEQLVSYVDNGLDQEDREILEEHLVVCERCQCDVQSFVAHRREVEPELKIRYAPAGKRTKSRQFMDWWGGFNLSLKPIYAASALLLISALAVSTILLRRGDPPQPGAIQVAVTPTYTPVTPVTPTATPITNEAALNQPASPARRLPPPSGTGKNHFSRLPVREANHADPAQPTNPRVSVRGGKNEYSPRDSNHLIGLENLSVLDKQMVKETLSSGAIRRPSILDDLVAETSSVRGPDAERAPFTLLTPRQTVIVETMPTFKWEPLKDALGYKVYLASKATWNGVSSPLLSPSVLEWSPHTPLRRGETYSWVVSAITAQGEFTVPAASEPERKFKVLGEGNFRALMKLKRQTSSPLVLGLFYARSGLIFEAEREFQRMAEKNTDSPLAKSLLDQMRSWH
jgi:hypothetical protein